MAAIAISSFAVMIHLSRTKEELPAQASAEKHALAIISPATHNPAIIIYAIGIL